MHDGTTRLADETEAWTIAVTDADAHWHGWGLLRAAGWLRVGWLCACWLRVGENLRLFLPMLLLGL